MGWMPDWYPLLRAAKYLNVPPWELLDQPLWWREKALIAERVEAEVENERAKRAQQSSS
jgi:hypothetical protein